MPIGTILLAEDDEMVRSFVRSVLERHGYCVLAAESGTAAKALAERVGLRKIDLVLTDIDMPLLDGVELVRCLRQMLPELKILYMTGHRSVHVDKLWMDGGVIQKPFAYGALIRWVDACLSQETPVGAGA
jgi:DNA-binding response OmpR family regulator